MSVNPYEVLGLSAQPAPDATAVKAAYRRSAHNAHPDRGGNDEWFGRVKLARDVLLDPERRKRFDETGKIEAEVVNHERVAAIQILSRFIAILMNGHIQAGFSPATDPRGIDVVSRLHGEVMAEIGNAYAGIDAGKKFVAFLADMKNRFRLKVADDSEDANPLARDIERQIETAQKQMADLENGIKARRHALHLLEGYEFESDQLSIFSGPRG